MGRPFKMKKQIISHLIPVKTVKKIDKQVITQNWGYCPNCKNFFSPISNVKTKVVDEWCMQLQPEHYCSGKTIPVTYDHLKGI